MTSGTIGELARAWPAWVTTRHLGSKLDTAGALSVLNIGMDMDIDAGVGVGVDSQGLTQLLRAWRQGQRAALDKIAPLIADELRRLAAFHLRNERPGHTFSPTDLISEAYLRLMSSEQPEFNDRAHFFAIASRNMRQILVDHARRRHTKKRGEGERPIELDEMRVLLHRPQELVALNDALEELEKFDERKAQVIELHYFGGLTQDEIAAVCDIHVNTVARDLRLGVAWLRNQLRDAT